MKDKTGKWKLEIKRGGERRVKRKSESRASRCGPQRDRGGLANQRAPAALLAHDFGQQFVFPFLESLFLCSFLFLENYNL